MATGSYLSRFTVSANTLSLTATIDAVAHGPLYIPAGTYYLDSATASESLVAAIDTLLEANWGAEDFTVTYAMDTGKVTIACTTLGATWSMTFNQALADLLGWGSTLGWGIVAGASQVSPEVCQCVIFPGSGRSQWAGIESDIPNEGHRSGSGVSAGVGQADELLGGTWVHAFERQVAEASPLESGTRDDADAVRPWTWQDFFRHHRQTHHPFRFYDGTGLTVAQYEKVYKLDGKSLGKFAPKTQEEGSWYWWIIQVEAIEWKAATP